MVVMKLGNEGTLSLCGLLISKYKSYVISIAQLAEKVKETRCSVVVDTTITVLTPKLE